MSQPANHIDSIPMSADSDILVTVDGVGKKFCSDLKTSLMYGLRDVAAELFPGKHACESRAVLRPKEFWAVKDVSFELRRGECLGLIGLNGAGKTTLLKMLNGLIKPDTGRIEMRGKIGAMIALGAGFNPVLTGRENVYVNAAVLGFSKSEIDARFNEIIDFADIGDFIDSAVQTYSSGMQVRLGFAVATALEPDVLLLDEVLAVGDVAFRSKCFNRIGKLINKCAVIFVSHDAVQMSRICDYGLYLDQGRMVSLGKTQDVLALYSNNNRPLKGEQSIVTHPAIKCFKFSPAISYMSWGESLQITIDFDASLNIISGLALLTLLDGEVSVVQSDFTEILNSSLQNAAEIQIHLGPLHLQQGEYSFAVTILDESKKVTLLHAIHCAAVHVHGPKGFGVYYQAPCLKGIL